jgi:hypothetical protein
VRSVSVTGAGNKQLAAECVPYHPAGLRVEPKAFFLLSVSVKAGDGQAQVTVCQRLQQSSLRQPAKHSYQRCKVCKKPVATSELCRCLQGDLRWLSQQWVTGSSQAVIVPAVQAPLGRDEHGVNMQRIFKTSRADG